MARITTNTALGGEQFTLDTEARTLKFDGKTAHLTADQTEVVATLVESDAVFSLKRIHDEARRAAV